ETVTDKDSGSGSATFVASVANANPVVTSGGNQSATEGTSKSFSLGSFSDLGVNDGAWSVDVNWGDKIGRATCRADAERSVSDKSHSQADNGVYAGTETVTDKDSGSGSATFVATVANANPVVTSGGNQSTTEGTSKSFSLGSFSDLGLSDGPWSVDVNWGD